MRSAEVNQLRKRLLVLKYQLHERHGAVCSENERHLADEGGVPADRDFRGYEQDVTVAKAERDLMEEVTEALGRIQRGAFGKCEDCKKDIAHERLEALPYARYCAVCARRRSWGSL